MKEILGKDEHKILQVNKELETILDAFPGPVFYKDKKGNYIRVNKYVADAHHMTKKELEGKSNFELYPKKLADAYLKDDLEVIKNGKPKLFIEEPWETAEGIKWVSTCKIPYVDEKGNIIGIIGISIDITECKRTKEELQKKISDLERFNKLTVDREIRMIELKSEVNKLLKELGREKKYSIPEEIKVAHL